MYAVDDLNEDGMGMAAQQMASVHEKKKYA